MFEQGHYAQDYDPEDFVLAQISTVVEKFPVSNFPHNAWFNEWYCFQTQKKLTMESFPNVDKIKN